VGRIETLETNLSSNVTALRTDITSNVTVLRTDLQSNVTALRTDLQSNVTAVKTALRTDLQSNVTAVKTALRTDLQSNVTALRTDLQSNVTALRTDLQSNVTALRTDITSNVTVLRTDLQSNVTTLRTDITSNVTRIGNLESSDMTIGGEKTFSSNLEVGTANFFVDTTTGNVGIGTASPDGRLHICSGTSGDCHLILHADTDNNNETDNPKIMFRQDGGIYTAEIGIVNTNNMLALRGTGGIAFYDGSPAPTNIDYIESTSTELMRIDTSGNVGIGTASPGQKLSIYTGSTSTSALSFDRFSSGNYRTDIYQNTYGPDFRVGYNAYTPESILYLKRFSDGRKEVEINGNVGIGTPSPGAKLDVSGDTIVNSGEANWDTGMKSLLGTQDLIDAGVYNNGSISASTDVDLPPEVVNDVIAKFVNNDTGEVITGNPSTGYTLSTGDVVVFDVWIYNSSGSTISSEFFIFGGATQGLGFSIPSNSTWTKYTQTITASAAGGFSLRMDNNSAGKTFYFTGLSVRVNPSNTTNAPFTPKGFPLSGTGTVLSVPNIVAKEASIQTLLGNVGIGLTGPESRLHIYGTDNPLMIQSQRSPYPKLSFDWSGNNAENLQFYDHHGSERGFLYGRRYTTGTTANPYAGWNFYGKFSTDGTLMIGVGGKDDGAMGSGVTVGRKNLFIQSTFGGNTSQNYGWWIGAQNQGPTASDNDLYFGVVRNGTLTVPALIQDSTNNVQMNFTGQHRTFVKGVPIQQLEDKEGLIVSADQNDFIRMSGGVARGNEAITTNESLPIVSFSTKSNDKKCFGVISTTEDPENRVEVYGNFASKMHKELGDTRVYINSVGEGAIWVTDINGPLESGDYITTSNVAGYGMRQEDDILHNYTVAKITMDCNFNPRTQPKKNIKKELANVDYWIDYATSEIKQEEYETLPENEREIREDKYYKIYKREIQKTNPENDKFVHEVQEELVNVLDEHGQLQWEDHPTETEKAYKIRYLTADGTETDEANAVHIAAFVGCTYHCG
jgi:hypothetical protein